MKLHRVHTSYLRRALRDRGFTKYVAIFVLAGAPLIFLSAKSPDVAKELSHNETNLTTEVPTEEQSMTSDQAANDQTSEQQSGAPGESSPGGTSSSSSVTSNLNVSSSTGSDGTSSTSVQINGEDVPVPANGQLHHTIIGPDGSVSNVDVSSTGTNQTGNGSSSSVNIQVDSSNSSQ